MKTKILIFFLFFGHFLIGQIKNDSLNQFNSHHKKNGLWKVYLTENLIQTKDTTKACYYGYNYYDNGQLVILIASSQPYKKKAIKIVRSGEKPKAGQPLLLNGNFKFYYTDGLGLEEDYKDGLPVLLATCATNDSGKSVQTEVLDYSARYNDQFGTFLYETMKTDGTSFEKKWFGKNKKGKWTFIK